MTEDAPALPGENAPSRNRLIEGRAWLLERYTWLVFRTHNLTYRASHNLASHKGKLFALLALAIIVADVFGLPRLHCALGDTFQERDPFAALKAFCLAVGAALIGATAIASSFILFAMQVNVERMPAGLFRRLSADPPLLWSFALAYIISALVALASLAPWPSWDALLLVGTIELCAAVLVLYLYAYRRALKLINPAEQLKFVVQYAVKDLRAWERHANLAKIFFKSKTTDRTPMPGERPADTARVAFFKANAAWDQRVRESIDHVTAYARSYAERGDHEVSYEALRALVAINGAYIKAKGATFFNNALLVDNPFVTDGIVNKSLEALRQTMQIALARGDEAEARQTLETFEFLLRLYLQIEYPGVGQEKTHASFAAGYLTTAVESVLPHGRTDVLMEGIRLMGRGAIAFLSAGAVTSSTALVDKIGVYGAAGIARDDLTPVLLTAMEQLANYSVALLRTQDQRLEFAIGQVNMSVINLATLVLQIPDKPLVSAHSSNLGPYFSVLPNESFRQQLTQLVNALLNERAKGELPRKILRNLVAWSSKSHREFRDLAVLSVERRSAFTLDMISWITGIVETLMAASNAPSADDHLKEKLRENALHIAGILTWLPTDREAATHLEGVRLQQSLFEMAFTALRRGGDEVFDASRKMLLKWGVTAGAHQTGWGTLGRSAIALCAMSLGDHEREAWLATELTAAISKPDAPSEELRRRAARDLREEADKHIDTTFSIDPVEIVLGQHPYGQRRTYLRSIADILAPPVQNRRQGDSPKPEDDPDITDDFDF